MGLLFEAINMLILEFIPVKLDIYFTNVRPGVRTYCMCAGGKRAIRMFWGCSAIRAAVCAGLAALQPLEMGSLAPSGYFNPDPSARSMLMCAIHAGAACHPAVLAHQPQQPVLGADVAVLHSAAS